MMHKRYEYASVKQTLMNGVTVVHRISCMTIEPRHGREGTAQHVFNDGLEVH
jgi:hypothetical protein